MRRPAQDRLNPVSLEPFTEQKLLFYDYCAALGVPVPDLYGAVGRAGGWSRVSGRTVADGPAFAAFVKELPREFVAKPAFGYEGLGIRVLSHADGRVIDSEGSPMDPLVLYDELCSDQEFDLHLVQERVHNHPEIAEIAESPVLQTIRMNTIVRPDGSVLSFGGVIKIATGTGDADNFHDGDTGNGFCHISLEDGTLGPLMVPVPGGLGFRQTPVVPGTRRRVEGRRIPFVRDARELVERSALLFQPMRTLGWDVAVTPRGPVVIEANNWWAPFTALPPEAWELLLAG